MGELDARGRSTNPGCDDGGSGAVQKENGPPLARRPIGQAREEGYLREKVKVASAPRPSRINWQPAFSKAMVAPMITPAIALFGPP